MEWFVGPVDVVHGTNFVVPPTRRAARVVTVHDLTTVRYPELCDRSTLGFPRWSAGPWPTGAWVHTPSQFVADEVVAEFGADPSRVRVVHHGIGLPPPADPGASGRRPRRGHRRRRPVSTSPTGADRYILAVGTVEPRKDYPGLVRAFDRRRRRPHPTWPW